MCGSFFVNPKNPEINKLISKLPNDSLLPQLGNVFPGNFCLTIVLENENIVPQIMVWGFPNKNNRSCIFNARSESALQKPLFRTALLHHPIAIPTNGFYEWKTISGQKKKEKFIFTHPQDKILYLAGFWKLLKPSPDVSAKYFTILTTTANNSVLSVHHRMPILLRNGELIDWFKGINLYQIFKEEPFNLLSFNCAKVD